MSQQVYTDSQHLINKLKRDDNFSLIVEVYKDNGRLIAGLFELNGGDRK